MYDFTRRLHRAVLHLWLVINMHILCFPNQRQSTCATLLCKNSGREKIYYCVLVWVVWGWRQICCLIETGDTHLTRDLLPGERGDVAGHRKREPSPVEVLLRVPVCQSRTEPYTDCWKRLSGWGDGTTHLLQVVAKRGGLERDRYAVLKVGTLQVQSVGGVHSALHLPPLNSPFSARRRSRG